MIADAAAMFDVSRVAMIVTIPMRRPTMSASTHAAAEIMAVVVPMRRLTTMLAPATGANSKGGMLVGPTGTAVGTIGRMGLGDDDREDAVLYFPTHLGIRSLSERLPGCSPRLSPFCVRRTCEIVSPAVPRKAGPGWTGQSLLLECARLRVLPPCPRFRGVAVDCLGKVPVPHAPIAQAVPSSRHRECWRGGRCFEIRAK